MDRERARARGLPMMMVLSLSSLWDVSIEGMVPDIERSLGIVDVVVESWDAK